MNKAVGIGNMLETLVYEEKNVLLQNTHPLVVMLFLTVLLFQALLFSHPLYLLGVLIIILLAVAVSEAFTKCELYLTTGLVMAVLIVVINALVSHGGRGIVWQGPYIPLLGKLSICLEAICYGAAMGVRLLIVLVAFGLFNAVMHPDKTMNLFSRVAFKSALIVLLSTRMLPGVARDLAGVIEVQQMRGVDFGSGSFMERLRKYSGLLQVILMSSLEGALQIAETMHARAFGCGPRSCYRRFFWRRRDSVCGLASILALVFSVCVKVLGYSDYSYYPQLGQLVRSTPVLIWLGLIMLALLVVVAMGWGWIYCPYLRSKI